MGRHEPAHPGPGRRKPLAAEGSTRYRFTPGAIPVRRRRAACACHRPGGTVPGPIPRGAQVGAPGRAAVGSGRNEAARPALVDGHREGRSCGARGRRPTRHCDTRDWLSCDLGSARSAWPGGRHEQAEQRFGHGSWPCEHFSGAGGGMAAASPVPPGSTAAPLADNATAGQSLLGVPPCSAVTGLPSCVPTQASPRVLPGGVRLSRFTF